VTVSNTHATRPPVVDIAPVVSRSGEQEERIRGSGEGRRT